MLGLTSPLTDSMAREAAHKSFFWALMMSLKFSLEIQSFMFCYFVATQEPVL